MKKKIFILSLCLSLSFSLLANEGMWIPSLLKKYNIEEMQQMGFKLTAEDVYDVNNNSMKDAVVLFGRGCTGEMVSNQGLLFTNHHCGFGQIQAHSSLENDYLTKGFWAKNKKEELPNPGLEVRFLERMDDVSDMVFEGTKGLTQKERDEKIKENIATIEAKENNGEFIEAVVKPLFKGNQYFIYVYRVFKDVRLVGAPPSAIGKFGGDTDNWMWPRHTGDFSVFRVYANKNNQPAAYSVDNVPYRPKHHFPISIKGVEPEDFVMIFGFPGSTDEYLPSYAVDLIENETDPVRIAIRSERLSIMKKHMTQDAEVRIKYAAKYASVANGWKKWQGEIKGLKQLDAINKKKRFEAEFTLWLNKTKETKQEYMQVLPELEKLYKRFQLYSKAYQYYAEAWYSGTDIMSYVRAVRKLTNDLPNKTEAEIEVLKSDLQKMTDDYFKNYDQGTDEEVFVAMMNMMYADLAVEYLPAEFVKLMSSYDGVRLVEKIYRKSMFCNKSVVDAWIAKLSAKQLIDKDPMVMFCDNLATSFEDIKQPYYNLNTQIKALESKYMAGILAMKQGKRIYPDANNLTMRVAYGKVEGYEPVDGVHYKHYTTLSGIMAKDNPDIYDYDVPQRLRDLYQVGDYGRYALNDGELPVAFIASIHTTGGNSGSPAINANGELIGINFDRCWEGTMSDIMFDPDRCRNIMVDARYVLFVIEKFADAKYLLNEMTIVE
ncbi:MAG: S46 family peptidase [Mangrovibacterium sp.]